MHHHQPSFTLAQLLKRGNEARSDTPSPTHSHYTIELGGFVPGSTSSDLSERMRGAAVVLLERLRQAHPRQREPDGGLP
jgi:hypothetical protein